MLVVVDYGSGNVGSIVNMLTRGGVDATVASTPDVIENASKLILPGVGAFDSVVRRFSEAGLVEVVLERIRAGVPILGICVGMQIMGTGSDEGTLAGLGLVPARVRSLRALMKGTELKVPHMGWSNLIVGRPSPLLHDLRADARFYFVHSFAMVCEDQRDCVASIDYGNVDGVSAVIQRDNVFGVQFHPEKSRIFGMTLLRNFASRC